MRDVLADVDVWRKAGKPVVIATNVKRKGMSLRPLGAKMALTPMLDITGSVTGGCVETAIIEESRDVLKTNGAKLLHYGLQSDQKPWEIGLSCGSSLDIFLESLDSPAWQQVYPAVKSSLDGNRLAAVSTVISGPGTGRKLMVWPDGSSLGDLGDPTLNRQVTDWMLRQMADQDTTWEEFKVGEETAEVFIDVLVPRARLIIVGASHIAIPLVSMAKVMGYHTIVIDPREAFATAERFPHVDELIKEWPSKSMEALQLDEASYVTVISHDDKLDNPALAVALKSPARYVGVLGTRKNIERRHEALREMGVTDEQLEKLHAPIGIPVGAILPEEIAVSILAEVVKTRHSSEN
jgi:xanthine dehydrogenase accessory factor